MNKEILLNRFKSLLKEANKLDTIIRTSSLSLNKIEEDLKQIYLQEDSVFDDLLKKIHESGYDEQTIISTVMTQSTITIGRLLECYNLMKLLEVEPEFESPEDKMNFLNVKNSMELSFSFEGDSIIFEDSEFIEQVKMHRGKYIETLRENFKKDKLSIKGAQ